ncbi:MAG: NADP-dependent oxidoreductase [Gemmatimonadota bacterium]
MTTIPRRMRAAAIDGFGGIERLEPKTLPVPAVAADEVLIRVEYAGVGEWDAFEREGGYAEMLGIEPAFPYVLGSEGAGTVAAVGAAVRRFRVGDRVYALGFLNPRGGFYAEYAAVREDLVSPVPRTLTTEQAGVFGGVGITALRGLDDVLGVKPGMAALILGAGGGVGHLAVQLAKRMGARVLAVASGADGVALAVRLGADAAVDGRGEDVLAAALAFAPGGVDAALFTAGGEAAQRALAAVREGGRAAYPNGVHPEPKGRPGVRITGYNGEPDGEIVQRLDRLVEMGPFDVHVARTFPLERAAEAHRALGRHYLGKLALRTC